MLFAAYCLYCLVNYVEQTPDCLILMTQSGCYCWKTSHALQLGVLLPATVGPRTLSTFNLVVPDLAGPYVNFLSFLLNKVLVFCLSKYIKCQVGGRRTLRSCSALALYLGNGGLKVSKRLIHAVQTCRYTPKSTSQIYQRMTDDEGLRRWMAVRLRPVTAVARYQSCNCLPEFPRHAPEFAVGSATSAIQHLRMYFWSYVCSILWTC